MRAAVFFERDGILNTIRIEKLQQIAPRTLEEFQVNPEAVAPLRELKAAGFLLIAITNQPGLSRGYQSRRDLDLMHLQLQRRLGLDEVMVCPHDEMDRCPCRKPQPGLLTEASFKWQLDLDRCFMVSDKWQDARAAHAAGITSILLKSPWNGSGHHDFVLSDLTNAARKILQLQASPVLMGQV